MDVVCRYRFALRRTSDIVSAVISTGHERPLTKTLRVCGDRVRAVGDTMRSFSLFAFASSRASFRRISSTCFRS